MKAKTGSHFCQFGWQDNASSVMCRRTSTHSQERCFFHRPFFEQVSMTAWGGGVMLVTSVHNSVLAL